MSKYFDAEKFIKEFEKMIDNIPASVDSGAGYVIDEVYKIFDSLSQEQPEVDLEKEIDEYCGDRSIRPVPDFIDAVARHFYELGKTARK